LEKQLGNPKCCPHGNPIPSENGFIEEETCIALTEAKPGQTYTVIRIADEKQENLSVLAEKKIKPETQIQLTQRATQQVVLQVNGKSCSLDASLAACVFVRKAGRIH